jgi:hypothetical protein
MNYTGLRAIIPASSVHNLPHIRPARRLVTLRPLQTQTVARIKGLFRNERSITLEGV